MNIEKKAKLLAEVLEVEVSEFNADTVLASIPTWDSMAALSLIAVLEEHFGRSDIDGTQIKHMKKVEDVFKVMES